MDLIGQTVFHFEKIANAQSRQQKIHGRFQKGKKVVCFAKTVLWMARFSRKIRFLFNVGRVYLTF